MGMYDTIHGVPDKFDNQVKLWECLLIEYRLGDMVPSMNGHDTYSIRMPGADAGNRCYVLIVDGYITNVSATAPLEGVPVFSKWGGQEDEVNPIVVALREQESLPKPTRPNWFEPGWYTTRIKGTRAIVSPTERTYCIVEAEVLETRAANNVIVGETYTVFYNIDSNMGLQNAGAFVVLLDSEVPIGRPGEFLGRDEIVQIYNQALFNDRVVDVVCREILTRRGHPFLVHTWKSSQPRLGQVVQYTEVGGELSVVHVAIVSGIDDDTCILHALTPVGVSVIEAKRGFGKAGVPENVGKWTL